MRGLFARLRVYTVVLLAALVAVVWSLYLGSRPVSADETPVRVVISRGTSATKIADILTSENLIRNRLVFTLTCRFGGTVDKLKPGVYELSRGMSVPEIVEVLVAGKAMEAWVTVPEGFTARQIADLLDEKELVDGDVFVGLALEEADRFSGYAFVEGQSLEGYLFPDTYLISRSANAEDIIRKMLDAFQQKVADVQGDRMANVARKRFAEIGEPDVEGVRKVLTVASLIEREAKSSDDRALISAVLWNRLNKGMRLEVDATVSYEPGLSRENKSRVYYRDLASDSPYNTYKQAGLPPGPICNPGVASIEAAVDPADVDYLFYVAKPDGNHVFSRTFDEHVRAKNSIKRSGGTP